MASTTSQSCSDLVLLLWGLLSILRYLQLMERHKDRLTHNLFAVDHDNECTEKNAKEHNEDDDGSFAPYYAPKPLYCYSLTSMIHSTLMKMFIASPSQNSLHRQVLGCRYFQRPPRRFALRVVPWCAPSPRSATAMQMREAYSACFIRECYRMYDIPSRLLVGILLWPILCLLVLPLVIPVLASCCVHTTFSM